MINFRQVFILLTILLLSFGLVLFTRNTQIIDAQIKPLSYPEIITALNSKLPNQSFKNKTQLINFLISAINQRKVDKPLTADREDDLRQVGATDELIAVIKANSPSLPKKIETPPPTPIIITIPTPTVTPTPVLTPTPVPTPTPVKTSTSSLSKNSIGMEFVLIPAGSFMMGSEKVDDQKPVHKVTINYSFYMGKYEVTQGQWLAIMGNNPSKFSTCGNDCPVEKVSWNDAQEFIKNLNGKNDGFEYRLPSEAEWEYANRAGTTSDYYGTVKLIAWYLDNSDKTIHPVGQKQANSFGLYDMSGNVWEWCEDIYNDKGYVGLKADGSVNKSVGNVNYKILRGGSWVSSAFSSNSANRNFASSSDLGNDIGFRVVARAKQ